MEERLDTVVSPVKQIVLRITQCTADRMSPPTNQVHQGKAYLPAITQKSAKLLENTVGMSTKDAIGHGRRDQAKYRDVVAVGQVFCIADYH